MKIANASNEPKHIWKIVNKELVKNSLIGKPIQLNVGNNTVICYPQGISKTCHYLVLLNPSQNWYLTSIKNRKYSGLYEISVLMLNQMIHIIKKLLTFHMNALVRDGLFPQIFKKTFILPFQKIGKEPEMHNYR